jgi:hypothetical protein
MAQLCVIGNSNIARFLQDLKKTNPDLFIQQAEFTPATNAVQVREALSKPPAPPPDTATVVVVAALMNIVLLSSLRISPR